jgi:hypothetical protein
MVRRQQVILVSGGFFLLILLFFFGKTIPPKKPEVIADNTPHSEKTVDVEKMLTHAKERLTITQVKKVTSLENVVKRGDVKNQQLSAYSRTCILLEG